MKPLRDEMMTSRRALLLLAFLLAFLILAALQECEGRGARTSRTSRQGHTRSTSAKRNTKSSSKFKLRKRKTFYSSVTRRQTLSKTRPFNERFKKRAAIGITVYTLLNSQVYIRNYKPYHETSNIVIPEHRALRIKKENYTVLAKDGSRCQNGSLTKYDGKNVLNITTKVTYEKAKTVVGSIRNIPAVNLTDTKQTNLTLSADAINNYIVNIETRIAFNQSILENKMFNATTSNGTVDLANCTIFLLESQAYVVVDDESFALKNKANFVLSLITLVVSIIGLK